MILPDSTVSLGAFAADAGASDGAGLALRLVPASTVPVTSSFLPACGSSAASLATNRYVLAPDALGVLALSGDGVGVTLVRTNFSLPVASLLASGDAGVAVAGSGAGRRHPVTVILLSPVAAFGCVAGGDAVDGGCAVEGGCDGACVGVCVCGCCAAIARVPLSKAVAHTADQIRYLM